MNHVHVIGAPIDGRSVVWHGVYHVAARVATDSGPVCCLIRADGPQLTRVLEWCRTGRTVELLGRLVESSGRTVAIIDRARPARALP